MCANAVVRQLVNLLCRLALVVVLICKAVLVLLGTFLRAAARSAHAVHHGKIPNFCTPSTLEQCTPNFNWNQEDMGIRVTRGREAIETSNRDFENGLLAFIAGTRKWGTKFDK